MTVATISKPSVTSVFPSAAVEAALRSALLDSITSTAALHGIALPATDAAKCAASAPLDSLSVVALLCEVEPIVRFELKDCIVKSGGYNSIDEAINHVLPRIAQAWQKHASKGGSK